MLSRLFWTFSDSLVGRSSSRITTAEIGKGSFQKKRMGCSMLSWKMRKSSCCRSATRFPLGSFTVTGTSTSVVWTIILAGVCAGFAAGFCGEAALWEAVDCEAVPLWPAEEIEQTGNSTAAAKIVRNFLIFPLPPLHIARGEDITATCQVIAAAGRIRLRGGCIELSAMKNSYRLYNGFARMRWRSLSKTRFWAVAAVFIALVIGVPQIWMQGTNRGFAVKAGESRPQIPVQIPVKKPEDAQQKKQQQQPNEGVTHVNVNLVRLYVTVRDHHGAIIQNLEKKDFRVYEDGKEQTI